MRHARHPLPGALDIPSNLALAFERLADTFTPRTGLEPFRLPARPRLIKDLFPAYEENDELLDVNEIFDRLNPETLLSLDWSGSCGLGGYWAAYVAVLRTGRRLYLDLIWDDGPQVLAVGPPDFTRYTDLRFLQLLAASNGRGFGTGVVGSAPSGVSSDIVTSRDFMVDLFVRLFDASDAWDGDSVRAFTNPQDQEEEEGDQEGEDDEVADNEALGGDGAREPDLTAAVVIPASQELSPEDDVLYQRFAPHYESLDGDRDADVRTVERWLAQTWCR